MGIYKRGSRGIYWYRFVWNGKRIRASTKQTNARVAAQIEAAHRTALAKGEVGIRERKKAPAVSEFANSDFLPFVRSHFAEKPKTLEYYENGIKNLLASKLGTERMDLLTSEKISGYAGKRREDGLQVSSVNRELEVLRRMTRLASEWGRLDKAPPIIRMLPGERRRDRVITLEEEKRYLAAAPPLLRDVTILLLDTGLRPEECFRLRASEVRDGAIHISYGKTKSARRVIPLSDRAAIIIEMHRNKSEWIFPAGTKSGHIESSTLRKAHYKTCTASNVARFPIYLLRHTFLSRLSAHTDAYTLAYIAGHADMATTKRYVHPQTEIVRKAIERNWRPGT